MTTGVGGDGGDGGVEVDAVDEDEDEADVGVIVTPESCGGGCVDALTPAEGVEPAEPPVGVGSVLD